MRTKRVLALVMAAAMASGLLAGTEAFALGYSGRQNNEATFDTLMEAHANSPEGVKDLELNVGGSFIPHPVLDDYVGENSYVYRSANLHGGRAAARLNTNIFVFSDKHFENKDDAKAYLQELGVIDIIDQAIGSVILVTPVDPEAGFGLVDQNNYYKMQTAVCALKQSGTDADGNRVTYADGEYYGGFGYIYAIGIDGGATFLNNYVSSNFDFVSRLAGMLLVNGDMAPIREVAAQVPVYLANASEDVIAKYESANATDASDITKETACYYNQALPLQKVVVAKEEKTPAEYIHDAYYDLFIKAMRIPVTDRGLYTAGTPYQGYSFDQAPYSLSDRNAVIDGVTEDGIHVEWHQEDRFADTTMEDGEYLETWVEFLPEEVLNHTAPAGSIPLILAIHGTSDDPYQFVDEVGLLDVAGKERIAMVAPEHQYIGTIPTLEPTFGWLDDILPEVLPRLVTYMLETYPELDPSRVYVTGYSGGAGAAIRAIGGDASLFAAAVPMSDGTPWGACMPREEDWAQYDTIDLPIMFTTSEFDLAGSFNQAEHRISDDYQEMLNGFMQANGIEPVTYDFEANPLIGYEADRTVDILLNNEYRNTTWYKNNEAGVPMVAVHYTEGLVHALYPEYAKLAWNFMKQYSRNQETDSIEYNPYVD